MTTDPFESPGGFFIKEPIYSEHHFPTGKFWEMVDLLHAELTYDGFCIECNRDSVFRVEKKEKPARFKRPLPSPITSHGGGPIIVNFSDDIFIFNAVCTRDQSHCQHFVFLVDLYSKETWEYFIKKIGQSPSSADLIMPEIKKYRHVLDKKQARELNRAVGLASHNIGIGSFIYIRRIIETLIDEAHGKGMRAPGWDEELYQNARMSEKISLLTGYLPSFMVEHPQVYSILSKGIHELDEDECLGFFDTIKTSIELILDQKISIKELEQKQKEATAGLAKIQEILKRR